MRVIMEVRGRTSSWIITGDASREQIDAMREDGLDVGVVENRIPAWVVDIGLLKPWCFMQNVWNDTDKKAGLHR